MRLCFWLVAVPLVRLLVYLFIDLEQFVLQLSFLLAMEVVELVTRILRIILNLFARFKVVLFWSQNLFNVLQLVSYLFLSMTSHTVAPILSLTLLE